MRPVSEVDADYVIVGGGSAAVAVAVAVAEKAVAVIRSGE